MHSPFDELWLAGLPRQVPALNESEAAKGYVFRSKNQFTLDDVRHYRYPWMLATTVEAFATGIRFMTFFVPAGVGTTEGGLVLVFVAFGLGAPLGLAFALVRRLRELCWTAVGLIVLMTMGGSVRARGGALTLPTTGREPA